VKQVRLLPKASDDLVNIWLYIARDSEFHATRYLDRLEAVIGQLSTLSGAGRLRADVSEKGVRGYPEGSHVIFYVIERDVVEVLRIVHSAQDIRKIEWR
jgi:toxin ParE1/3/4